MLNKTRRAPDQPVTTLADVLKALAASPNVSPTRLRDMRSAISRICAFIGEQPERVALDFTQLRDRLNAINPVAAGISLKRLANIRSDFLAAITASGLKPARTARQQLPEPWGDLTKVMRQKRRRIGLSRLAHYASANELLPKHITDEVIDGFMRSVREDSLHRKPNELHRRTTVIWNQVAAEFPELHLHRVSVPSFRPPLRRADWSALPESFRKDLEECLAWCTNTDVFALDARARPLSSGSVKLRKEHIHTAVTALI